MSTITEQTAEQNKKRSKVKRSIIDCDIHHYTGLNVTKEYLPRHYRELMETYGAAMPGGMYFNGGISGRMADSFPPEGGPAGSSLPYMQEHHLDPNNVEYGILTGEGLGMQNSINYDYAAALAQA